MFDVRLRLMGDDGTTRKKVLAADDIMLTHTDSATPTLTFTVSEKVAGRMDAPLVVALEFSTGGPYKQPRNGLFMASADNSDDADQTGTVKFAGIGYVPWMLARTYLHWSASAVNGERQWIQFPSGKTGSATPGHTLNGMLVESKARGWGPMVSWDFTSLKDSAGANWSLAGGSLWWSPWRLLTPLTRVLDQLSVQGYMDWWTEGTKLRMFRPGVGVVRENLVLGGPKFSARPVRSSFDDVFTHLTVVPEKARNWLYLTNTGADTRFGRLEATMTQAGVERAEAATAAAQPILTGGRALKREYSFDWTPAAGGPTPFTDFNVGDVVVSKTRHGKSPQRVVGIVVSKLGDRVTARAIVGDKLLSQAAKQMQRTSAATIGGAIGGNGTVLPESQGPTYADPSAPTALRVESNEGSWRPDGTAQATVVLAWDAVSAATDGSGVDVREYEVAERVVSGESAVFATTPGLSVTESMWEPGIDRYVKVRAIGADGTPSDWSEEVVVKPDTPTSIVPKAPTALAEAYNVGEFRSDGTAVATVAVSWTPVTQSVDNALVDIAEYEVTFGPETQRVTDPVATFTVPSSKLVAVRVRALTTLGVWGDPSTGLNITGAVPTALLAAPTAPVLTTGQGIVFAAWGGNLVSGTPPVGFQHVVAELALASTGPWARVGTPIPKGGGGVNIRGVAGESVWVRFTPIDTLGRPGTVSASASIVVKAVEAGDIDQAITDAIAEATAKSNNAWDKASVAATDFVIEYAINSSETVAPASGWTTTAPTRTPGTFIWQRTIVTYGSGSTVTTSPVLVTGNEGAPGADGTGIEIAGSVATYAALPTGLGAADAGKGYLVEADGLLYIWSGTAFPTNGNGVAFKGDKGDQGLPGETGADGSPTYTWLKYADTPTTGMSNDPTGKTYMGLATNKLTATESSVYTDYQWSLIRGEAGEDAYTVLLTNESHTFPGSLNAAIAGTTTSRVMAYRGADPIAATIGAISGQQTGLTAVISANGTVDALVTVTVTTALTARSGTLTFPITVDGKLFTKTLTWAVARTGATGGTGAPGSDGADGADAPVITLVATTQVLTTPATGGATTPATATVTGSALNTTITVWQYSIDGAAFAGTVPVGVSRSGNVVTVTGNTMTARTIAVRMADAAGIADTITVAKVADGAQGLRGDQGIPGDPGADGVTTYTWVKYGTSAAGAGMSDLPDGKSYIGLAYNKTTQTESAIPGDYTWSLFKGADGADGAQGIPGEPGADGAPRFTWIKYATTPTTGMSDLPAGKVYMGIAYNKLTATESSVYGDYEWSLIKGEQGIPGTPGADGTERFTWIKYGTSAAGAGMSDSPTGKTYIGIAYNKTTATESSTPGDYEWSLVQGPQGSTGVSVTSVAVYYQMLPKGSAAPAAPTTTAPPAPWATTEPAYSANVELWAVTRVGYSDGAFSYTAVSKVSAYTAATEAGKRADDAQLTADGRNRIFTSVTEPVPAKVNLATNGSFEVGSGPVEVPWDSISSLRTIVRAGVASAQGYISDTMIDVEPGQIIRARVDWDSTDPAGNALFGLGAFKDGAWDLPGSGVTNWGGTDQGARWIGPVYSADRTRRVKHFVVPAGVTKVQFAHYRNAGSGTYSYTLSVHVVGDPDLEVAYYAGLPPELAVPRNGESILTGIGVPGVTANANLVAIRSSRWAKEGQYSLRLIPVTTSNNSYVDVGIASNPPTPANSTVTILATRHIEAALTGTLLRPGVSVYNGAFQQSPFPPNSAGDAEVRVTGSTGATSSTRRVMLVHGGSVGSGDVWFDMATLVEGTYTGPAFTTFTNGDLWYVLDPVVPGRVVGVKMWNGATWDDYQIVADSVLVPGSVGGTVIKDGAVTSTKVNAVEFFANTAVIEEATLNILTAGVIQVDMLHPNVGDSINLAANGSIEFVVGRQDQIDTDLSTLGGDVRDAKETADNALTAANTAEGIATGAQTSADTADAVARGAAEDIAQIGLWVKVTETAMTLGRPNTSAEMALTPEGIEFSQNSIKYAEWVGGVMITPEAKLAQASIANHQFLPYGAGRTIIRPL